MRVYLPIACLSLGAGFVLAQFLVLFYSHWYFGGMIWLKVGLFTIPLAVMLGTLQFSAQRPLVARICFYWVVVYLIAFWNARSPDLRSLSFTEVLNYEAAIVWIPVAWVLAYWWLGTRLARRASAVLKQAVTRQLRLRRRIREEFRSEHSGSSSVDQPGGVALTVLIFILGAWAPVDAQDTVEPKAQRQYADRHVELKDESRLIIPPEPALPGMYPTPLHLRAKQTFWIRIDNRKDGQITVFAPDSSQHLAGKVLAPVAKVNPNGFTASGWGAPGRITATSVNAIHVKVDHDYSTGKGVIFSLTPVEFADFDPKNYKSYFNSSSSLFTDIPAGKEIFGGRWAPLVGSRLYLAKYYSPPDITPEREAQDRRPGGLAWGGPVQIGLRDSTSQTLAAPDGSGTLYPATPDYRPAMGDTLYFRVERLKYNPEWIEFENRFGGLIWVKEIGLDAYPIGQVLKPVVGCGRFLGTQYAGVGRIRANHPGVIDISTTPEGVTGGFQIIPRDHSMSPEMTNARVKTQWMVIGPLYALDPSWEGLPPLFTDYLYPAWTPSDSEQVQPVDAYLGRFTVRARYGDDPDPDKFVLLHEKRGLDNLAFKSLTHLRIYFPRDSRL